MTERLFQFIWQSGYYNHQSLLTTDGEPVQVISPGIFNTNQGPDFCEARIKIGKTTWVGNVELHIRSSDWNRHGHQDDPNYQNVILHVVWRHDLAEKLPFPTLELEDKVSAILLSRYDDLMNLAAFIPCEKQLCRTDELVWLSWKERMLVERLTQRSLQVNAWLQQNNTHWVETLWWMIARNFGIPQNSETFLQIAQSIPMNVLAKCKTSLPQLEALLFGQCGMLDKTFAEDYPAMLAKEYRYLKSKYKLRQVHGQLHFLRMRPANFPSVRLAQLAALVHNSIHLFAQIRDHDRVQDIKKLLDVTANDYWHYHYVFDEPSAFRKKNTGAQMVDNIIINTAAPMLFAFGKYQHEKKYMDKAIRLLGETAGEKNTIIRGFGKIGMNANDAASSQALIHLKKEYCDVKRCLDCAVGNKLLKGG